MVGDSTMSLPETTPPISRKMMAIALVPGPPTPTMWIRGGTRALLFGIAVSGIAVSGISARHRLDEGTNRRRTIQRAKCIRRSSQSFAQGDVIDDSAEFTGKAVF